MPTLHNPRWELYCQGVAEGKTSDQAYIDAGYKPGRNNAARLRATESIKARIKELQDRGLKRHDITIDKIIEEYAKLAFSDIRQLFDENGNLLKPGELGDQIAGALTSMEVVISDKPDGSQDRIAKIRLADKRSALADLGKHFHMFTEDMTIKAEVVHKNVSDLEMARRIGYMLTKGADDESS